MNKSTLDEFVSDPRRARILQQERFVLEATECVARVLQRENIPKTELAARLGKSPAFVSQVLSGSRNMTLRTFADFLYALGHTARLVEEPLCESGGNIVRGSDRSVPESA